MTTPRPVSHRSRSRSTSDRQAGAVQVSAEIAPRRSAASCHGPSSSRSSFASARARSIRSRSTRSFVKRRSLQPDWRVPSSWPSPRSSRSTSASSKPSVVLTSASQARLRDVRQLELVARDEQAVALLRPAPDAPAQLVQLGEPEAVGLLHDHDRRVRHVDADLDHRRRDEHVELAVLELPHHLAPVGRSSACPCSSPTR